MMKRTALVLAMVLIGLTTVSAQNYKQENDILYTQKTDAYEAAAERKG